MNNQKMLDVVTMIANVILSDKCDHESALEIWLRAMKRKAREALESHESEAVGNAAAMREALKTIHDKVNSLDEECGVDPVEIRDIARAALSKPARNCDRFTSVEQAKSAYCSEGNRAVSIWDGNESLRFEKWLFAPAAERKGEGDGK